MQPDQEKQHHRQGTLPVIAHIRTPFTDTFGIPRQSGLAPSVPGDIVFTAPYRDAAYVRGLEQATHLWLIWRFSQTKGAAPSATVRPPMLGGNQRIGVFASRSPFRPSRLGLSCVRLSRIEHTPDQGPVLHVLGADLMDGTAIYDIKPYVPYADCMPEASYPLSQDGDAQRLQVVFPQPLREKIPAHLHAGLIEVLAQDPRPRYQQDAGRIYGFGFAGRDVRFRVQNGVLTVCEIV